MSLRHLSSQHYALTNLTILLFYASVIRNLWVEARPKNFINDEWNKRFMLNFDRRPEVGSQVNFNHEIGARLKRRPR